MELLKNVENVYFTKNHFTKSYFMKEIKENFESVDCKTAFVYHFCNKFNLDCVSLLVPSDIVKNNKIKIIKDFEKKKDFALKLTINLLYDTSNLSPMSGQSFFEV